MINDELDKSKRRPARFQISENTLFNAGMDRPTVEALRHLLNKVGSNADTSSLPDAVTVIDAIEIAPFNPVSLPSPDDLAPAHMPCMIPDDLRPTAPAAEQVEFLQTEMRQLAETVAALTTRIHDLEQGIKL